MKPYNFLNQSSGSAAYGVIVFLICSSAILWSASTLSEKMQTSHQNAVARDVKEFYQKVERSDLLSNAVTKVQTNLSKSNKFSVYCGTAGGLKDYNLYQQILLGEEQKNRFTPYELGGLCKDMPRMAGTLVIRQTDAFYVPFSAQDKLSFIPPEEIFKWVTSVESTLSR